MSPTCLPLLTSADSLASMGGPTTGTPVTVIFGKSFWNAA